MAVMADKRGDYVAAKLFRNKARKIKTRRKQNA
jgi:hypothetical protein